MRMHAARALIVCAVGALLFASLYWSGRPRLLVLAGHTMGTTWSVQLNTRTGQHSLDSLAQQIDNLLHTLDREIFSTWNPESELSRLNRDTPQSAVPVSADLLQVLQAAMAVHEASGAAFDPSIGPLVDAWGFGPAAFQGEVDPLQVARARERLGMHKILFDTAAGTLQFTGDIQLDLSGIAKGYAVDRLADLLLAHDEEDFLVEIGGEIRVAGWRPDGSEWRLGIEVPAAGTPSAMARIAQQGRSLALASSGDYRNFRLIDGKRHSHEIDPRSGRPVDHDLAAVTVLAETAMLADAWATALMVLGPQAGLELANRLRLPAYFIIRSPEGFASLHSTSMSAYLTSGNPGS